jgi:hypothetical protein
MFRIPLSRWVVLFAASGFPMLWVDVEYEHHSILTQHPAAWAPLVFAPVGLVVFGLAALIWRVWLLRIVQVLGVLGLAVGLAGTAFHNQDRFTATEHEHEAAARPGVHVGLLPPARAAEEPTEQEGEHATAASHGEEGEAAAGAAPVAQGNPEGPAAPKTWLQMYYADPHPPLAPLSFAGLGLLGLLGAGFGVRRIRLSSAHVGREETGED